MRIISKQHDYYDCICKYGVDRSIVFVRDAQRWDYGTIECPDSIQKGVGAFQDDLCDYDPREYNHCDCFYIFFCGQVYRGTRILTGQKDTQGFDIYTCVYTGEQLETWAGRYSAVNKKRIIQWLENGVQNGRGFLDKSTVNFNSPVLMEYALKERIPYFVVHHQGRGMVLTPVPLLKDWSFMRIVPADQAFQRIQAFISNDLAREREMPILPVPDKIMAEGKGFDKWSFRKEPTSKKRVKR